MHIRYTALDGGDKLKKPASDTVKDYIKSVEDLSSNEGLFAVFDLQHDFPNEWYKAMRPPADATERVLALDNLFERLPIFTKGRKADKILAADVYLYTTAGLSASALKLTHDVDEFAFTDGPPVGTMKSFAIKDAGLQMSSWLLKINDVSTQIDKVWTVVRYILK
jgi:hypothetical protein